MRPLADDRILDPPSRRDARSTLGLADDVPVVLISGGGWGVGDLTGAAEVALTSVPEAVVICLAGHSQDTRRRLLGRFRGVPRARVLGFTDQMPELLAGADVLVHTTGGTTALEARIVGCPLINYGTSVAHVRAHARAMADLGLAEWAADRQRLGPALTRALARGPTAPLRLEALPAAADLILQLARHGARLDPHPHDPPVSTPGRP